MWRPTIPTACCTPSCPGQSWSAGGSTGLERRRRRLRHFRSDPSNRVPPACARSGRPAFPALEDWIEIFRHSIGSFRRTAEADPSRPAAEAAAGAARFADAYLALVNELERQALAAGGSGGNSGAGGKQFGCLELCQLRWVVPAVALGTRLQTQGRPPPGRQPALPRRLEPPPTFDCCHVWYCLSSMRPCREEALIAAGFVDIFLPIKARENASALELLPGVCAELDQHAEQVRRQARCAGKGRDGGRVRAERGGLPAAPGSRVGRPPGPAWRPQATAHNTQCGHARLTRSHAPPLPLHCPQRDRWDAVIRGVFAGNIFDLGCAATTDMYHQARLKNYGAVGGPCIAWGWCGSAGPQ